MAAPDGQAVKASRLSGSSRPVGSRFVCLVQPPRWAPRPGSAIFAGATRSSLVPAGLGRHVSSRIFGIFGRYDIISTPLFHTT